MKHLGTKELIKGNKKNAWCNISPKEYDSHMSHPNVVQTQILSTITKEQFELLPKNCRKSSCVAILGITNGNGLEHVIPCNVGKVIGIDINKNFLDECKTRYKELDSKLELFHLDLTKDTRKTIQILAKCNLIIANLLIKHIHLNNFIKIIADLPKHNQIVSCVIQLDPDGIAVSKSGFENVFSEVSKQRKEENEEIIILAMKENKFTIKNRTVYNLPNGKLFIRLDFIGVQT